MPPDDNIEQIPLLDYWSLSVSLPGLEALLALSSSPRTTNSWTASLIKHEALALALNYSGGNGHEEEY